MRIRLPPIRGAVRLRPDSRAGGVTRAARALRDGRARPSTRRCIPVRSGDISIEETKPSLIGGPDWAELAGPWEIDYSYANMRAVERHPFNDSTDGQTFWLLVRRGGDPIGFYAGYVTETYNFATLFLVGWQRAAALIGDRLYRWLNRRGLYRYAARLRLAWLLRMASGRSRVMFLGTHTADIGGQAIGERLRALDPAVYLPALVKMIDRRAGDLRVEQIGFREAAEQDAGPFQYPNLWQARDERGSPILAAAGYHRDAGFPPAYIDLREVQKRLPFDGRGIFAYYRHENEAAFVAHEAARRQWLLEAARRRQAEPEASLPVEMVLRHPVAGPRADQSRLHHFRAQLFRSGILPDALVEFGQVDRAEGALKNAARTQRRLERLRAVRDLRRSEAQVVSARLPADALPDVYLLARSLDPHVVELRDDVAELAAVAAEERALAAVVDPRFASLPSAQRRKFTDLAAGRIRQADRERARLLAERGWSADASAAERAAIEAAVDDLVKLASREGDRDRSIRRLRTQITELARRTGVLPDDAAAWLAATDLLALHGGRLPLELDETLSELAAARERVDDAVRAVVDAEDRLRSEAAALGPLLLGERTDAVRADLLHAMRSEFRREQDAIAGRGRALHSLTPAVRRARIEAELSYRPLDYASILRASEALRDSDRERILREHRVYRAAIRRAQPEQPGPDMPAFDAEGYLLDGLSFSGRDERVWTNLADQDQITALYHRTMDNSLIRHDVMDWPYLAAYRAAGSESGDILAISTLRAGGPTGPIVAAVTLKRSSAGHFRPERIAIGGPRFGAYYSLVFLVMAHELALGGTFCSLGQTSQGTKLREFGAAFIDVHEYTRFRGLVPRVMRYDRVRQNAFRRVHVDRILEIAALPPRERELAARRHGIRWRI